MKVSVIIPIYGVESFIAKCARSLMEQTLEDIEYIFVDDSSPDKSMDILRQIIAEYPDKASRVKICIHDNNQGLPAARNSGLALATGEYIFHCDSDDFIDSKGLEQMYNFALAKDADIVWCDWFLSFEKNERYMKQPNYSTALAALKAMMCGGMKFNVWNKLVKRSLYIENSIRFPAGYGMGEDMTIIRLFACTKKVAYLPKAFYHYVKTNGNAISCTYSRRHLDDLIYNVEYTSQFVKSRYGNTLDKDIAFMKLEAKFPLLLLGDYEKIKLWNRLYPESNSYIMENNYISLRSRLLQWFAYKKQYWVVWLYYVILKRVVYGILYR